MNFKRREFVLATGLAVVGLALGPSRVLGKSASESKLRLGFIGVGLRGTWHLENALKRNDVDVIAICDINPERLAICRQHIAAAGHRKAREFGAGDFDY